MLPTLSVQTKTAVLQIVKIAAHRPQFAKNATWATEIMQEYVHPAQYQIAKNALQTTPFVKSVLLPTY